MQSSFKDVGASDEMVKALRGIGIERPSYIQAAAYQVLTSGARHIVLADHAGAAPISVFTIVYCTCSLVNPAHRSSHPSCHAESAHPSILEY